MSSSRATAVLLCSSLSLPSASSNFLFSAERVVRQLNQDAPEPTRKPSTEESNVFTMDLEEWNLCAAKRPAKEVPQSIDFLKHGWATSSFKLFEGLSMKVWKVWLTLLLSSSLISYGSVVRGERFNKGEHRVFQARPQFRIYLPKSFFLSKFTRRRDGRGFSRT